MQKYSSTKKANYRHASHKNYRSWIIILTVVISVGLLFPWLISRVSAIVLFPIHYTTTWVKTSDRLFPSYLRSKADLVSEIESLKSEIATRGGTQMSINRLLEENMQLRGMNKASVFDDRVVARVLARPDTLTYDLLQIDKGISDGVVEGSPVYTGVDSVLGIVVHTAEDYSFVDLFTSPGFKSTAFIIGPNVFSSIEGVGGGVARVSLPQGVSIRLGQLVILPNVSNGIYGEIVRVESEPTQPEQYGYITPPLAMNSLLYVSVGLKPVQVKSDFIIDEQVREAIRKSTRLSDVPVLNFSSSSQVQTTSSEEILNTN